MKIINSIFATFLSIFLSGCMGILEPTMTPLEIQSLQSRQCETTKEIVFPSVIFVFQDLGYTISHADIQTGLISAESAANSDLSSKFLSGITTVSQTKATAFVENIGSKTKVRLTFVDVNKTCSNNGQTDQQDTVLLNARLYQNAFDKIENEIFIRSQN